LLQNIVASGHIGVNFFFILSGFILAYNYLDADGRLRVRRRDFWIARFARIYPVYVVALLVALIPFVHGYASASRFRNAFTMATTLAGIQAWIPFSRLSWNPPAWSLSVEAFFYLLFPLIAVYAARLGLRQLYLVLGVLWIGYLALVAVATVRFPHGLPYAENGLHVQWLRIVWFNPYVRLPEFVAGVILARLFLLRASSSAPVLRSSSEMTRARALLPVVSAVAIIVLLATGIFGASVLPTYVVLDPLLALLIYSLASSRGPLASFLSLPIMLLLGEASYSLYILHFPVRDWLGRALDLSSAPSFVVYLAVVIGLSILSLYVVEQPARHAIKRLSTYRRGADTVGAGLDRPAPIASRGR